MPNKKYFSLIILLIIFIFGCNTTSGTGNSSGKISIARNLKVGEIIDGDTFWVYRISNSKIQTHPGKTDENGGHWDHNTGTYHYHNSETETEEPVTYYVDDLPQGSFKVRLSRVRAPETGTSGAEEAKSRLAGIISNKIVDLQKVGNSYDRIVCEVTCEGRNVSDIMLSFGYTNQGN